MAKYENIRALAKKQLQTVTESSDRWKEFLRTAAIAYNYSFPNQLLIYIEKIKAKQARLEQQLASAEEEVKRPFPQAAELAEKSNRLAVLDGLLNMNDKDIVTDTEPEQQCQAANRQRGQEER